MKCLSCELELVNIIYGKPTKRLIEIAKTDGIALGGIKRETEVPKYYCYGCHESY